ncbi:hypothetical protein [Parasphingorhabdus sp.]|uniref:hypothetical protein n=1 Tax=Parasphingorhabdus sp. TaxID=2709688 RepID=UPI002B26617D|nr:hypothetical protein [Parasphingorhabdus sp.]
MTEPITFNIVYTPGTVIHLLPFVRSLLRQSAAHFRLVDNGCMVPERRILEEFVKADDRLALWQMSGDGCRPHGEVLDALFALETPGPFAFMDSDIVASGPFLDDVLKAAEAAPAVFSGAPVWLADGAGIFEDDFQSLTGEYIWDSRGDCLGCTYLAVYDRALLGCIKSGYGLRFGEYRWEDLPLAVQQELARRGRQAAIYDTGKAINAMLPTPGHYIKLINIHHLGGYSFPALRAAAGVRGRLARWGLDKIGLLAPLRRLRSLRGYRRFGKPAEARSHYRRRVLYRDPVRQYFHLLLRNVSMGGSSLPTMPYTDCALVNAQIAAAAVAILENYSLDDQAAKHMAKTR